MPLEVVAIRMSGDLKLDLRFVRENRKIGQKVRQKALEMGDEPIIQVLIVDVPQHVRFAVIGLISRYRTLNEGITIAQRSLADYLNKRCVGEVFPMNVI